MMRRQLYYTMQGLLHRQGSNAIKIVSLALGLLMSVFLFARIAFELSFDTFYHEADHLYIVKTGWMKNGVPEGGESSYTIIPIPNVIAEEFPDKVQGSTVSCSLFGNKYKLGDRSLEWETVVADTLYFSVLGLDVLRGNPQDLANPDVLFLSETAARQVFGDEEPLGKSVVYDIMGKKATLLVKGIFRDVPLNTSLYKRPEAVVSFPNIEKYTRWRTGWQSGGNYDGFVRLRSPQDAGWLNERISAAVARHLPPDSGLELSVHIAPIRSMHLSNAKVRKMVWIMLFLGVTLLFTTTLNYVLISISSLTQRAKAIGVHKCSGASGGSIFGMFLVETAVVIGAALLVIGILVYLFRDWMEELVAVPLEALFGWQHLYAPLAVVAFLFVLGGCLPAMLFARIPVTQVFRRYTSGRRGWKRVLLFVQFMGAAFLMGMMLMVFSQYRYVTTRDRGWRADRVAYLTLRGMDAGYLRSLLRSQPYVEDVASAKGSIVWFGANRAVLDNQGNELFYPRNAWFDSDFLPFIGLKLKEGHNLTGEGQLLVNSVFCEKMQWTDSPIGKRVNDYGTVVGLLDRFSFPDRPDDDLPVMVEWTGGTASWLHVRLKEPFEENLSRLNEEMQRISPQQEQVFRSMEQEIRSYSESVRVFRDVTLLVSLTILFIILLGLTGYVNDEVRLRSKEIAIRKVNGAEVGSVLWLLSRDVLWLAVPSVAIGIVGACRGGKLWVSQFSDIVPFPVGGYILAGCLLLLFIVLTVLSKAWRIANENPVLSLKSD